jgi:hypothetical protein
MKNKIFNFALSLCLMIPCMFIFCGCGPTANFTADNNVKTSTQAIIDDIAANIYNKSAIYGSSTHYSVAEIKEKDSDFQYYVKLGSIENIDVVDSFTLNNTTFNKTQKFELSIGNNNKINDLCYYVKNGELFVAAPIIAFETVNTTKIKINDVEFDFDLANTAETGSIIAFSSQDTINNTYDVQNEEYYLTLKNANRYFMFEYEGATAGNVVLTKKVISGTTDGSKDAVKYGLTLNDGPNNTLALYPIDYAATPNPVFNGSQMDYSFYANGKVFNAKLHISLA